MIGRFARFINTTAATFLLRSLSLKFAKRLQRRAAASQSPLLTLMFGLSVSCDDREEHIQQITKQELVHLLHQTPAIEMVVILYDRFKKLKQDEFKEELQVLINECRAAKIKHIYMIDQKEANYLYKIVDMLKNPNQQRKDNKQTQQKVKDDESEDKKQKKGFQVFFKSKQFNEAFQLSNNRERKINEQIKQIRGFEISINSSTLLEELNSHFSNPFTFNRSVVVKQCPGQGECVESYRRQVKSLIDSGMLASKADQFKFYLVVDHPQRILGASSEYVKSFHKANQKMHGKPIGSNRKQDTFIYRKDYFGNDIACWSDWFQKIGHTYDPIDRLLMFIHPRIHFVSKQNTMTDLLWYLRVARNSNECSISLNNTQKWAQKNSIASIQVLKMLYSYYPRLNYLIVNSEKTNQLIKHMNADSKYVVFKQDSQKIWKKEFLDLDELECLTDKKDRQRAYFDKFKKKVDEFIAHPIYRDMVEVNKELEINFDKLRNLKLRQQAKIKAKKEYIIRVCKSNCYKTISSEVLEQIKRKFGQPINVYWIDSTTQNIGVQQGSYLLKEGQLVNLETYLDPI